MKLSIALSLLTLATFSLTGLTGCSLLISNVRPVAEKSDDYGVMDISRQNPDWVKLDPIQEAKSEAQDTQPSEISDVAFQSKKTASIVSINSACRASIEHEEKDLRAFSDLLFLGISDLTQRIEKEIRIQDTPALRTTVSGKLNGEPMKLETVVLRRGQCIYDIMYIARPDHFADDQAEFSQFVSSLRLK